MRIILGVGSGGLQLSKSSPAPNNVEGTFYYYLQLYMSLDNLLCQELCTKLHLHVVILLHSWSANQSHNDGEEINEETKRHMHTLFSSGHGRAELPPKCIWFEGNSTWRWTPDDDGDEETFVCNINQNSISNHLNHLQIWIKPTKLAYHIWCNLRRERLW